MMNKTYLINSLGALSLAFGSLSSAQTPDKDMDLSRILDVECPTGYYCVQDGDDPNSIMIIGRKPADKIELEISHDNKECPLNVCCAVETLENGEEITTILGPPDPNENCNETYFCDDNAIDIICGARRPLSDRMHDAFKFIEETTSPLAPKDERLQDYSKENPWDQRSSTPMSITYG